MSPKWFLICTDQHNFVYVFLSLHGAHRIVLKQTVIITTIILSLPEVFINNGHPYSCEPCVAMKAL
jgi:uncharacterized membrane protein YkgB